MSNITCSLAPSYVATFISNNVTGGKIFSATTSEVDGLKKVAGRIIDIDQHGKFFVMRPMNGKKGNDRKLIDVSLLKSIKVSGTNYNVLN